MDIKTLDMLAMIRVDCSFWSARAKLQKDDLPLEVQNSMPPDQIATLGSKRLFDPNKLKVFNTLKARAFSVLDKKCVKFLGGWATHEDRLPELAEQLSAIAQEYKYETQKFLDSYVEGVASWAANFPGWENILLNAVPKVHELHGKFAFAFQMFKIAPQDSVSSFTGNTLESNLSNLEIDVMDEVARDIKTLYRECFAGKDKVTRKAFRPLQTLIDKVRSLGFIHHHLVGLEAVLVEAKTIGERRPDDEMTLSMVKSFLSALSTPQGVQAVCDDYCERNLDLAQVFDAFWIVNQQVEQVSTHTPGTGLPPTQPQTILDIPTTPEPAGVPTLPPGWGTPPVAKPSVPDFLEQARNAIDMYEDRKIGIEPTDFSKPVGQTCIIEDNGGLW